MDDPTPPPQAAPCIITPLGLVFWRDGRRFLGRDADDRRPWPDSAAVDEAVRAALASSDGDAATTAHSETLLP